MTAVNVVILDTPTTAQGIEWGLAIGEAPSLDTEQAREFLAEHCRADATDAYALVVPDELWSIELNGLPYLEADVDAAEFAALLAAIKS
jgi:hypothetical protein